jgi:hypothetical protein
MEYTTMPATAEKLAGRWQPVSDDVPVGALS